MPVSNFVLTVLLASSGAPLDAFTSEARDEARFGAECADASHACAYHRIAMLDAGGIRRLYRYQFPLANEDASVGPDSAAIRTFRWRCDEGVVEYARVSWWSRGDHERPASIEPTTSRLPGNVCVLDLPDSIEALARDAGADFVSVRVAIKLERAPGEAWATIPGFKGVRNRLIILAAQDRPLSLDSSLFGNRAYRGVLHGALIEEVPVSDAADGFVFASEYADWSALARRYRDAERALLPPAEVPSSSADEPRLALARAMAAMNASLRYETRQSNAGILPSRGPAEVLASGYAECKEMSLLLVHLLMNEGLDASAVITSTWARQPASLLVPDFAWADHVLVHVPALDAYVDMTAPVGHQIIDRRSGIFGTLGIHTGTGDFVVIR